MLSNDSSCQTLPVRPSMKNFGERVYAERPHQNMNVIWHDSEMAEPVTLSVEKSQSLLNDCRNFCVAQPAFTQAIIQPTMKPFRKQPGVFQFLFGGSWFGMASQPFVQFDLPLAEFVRRNGISQAEGDKVSATLLPPRRQMSASLPDWRSGIEGHERQDR